MYVHVYKKETIFWLQVRCADIFILIFSLFHYYLKARIINFTTYKNISADHITTEFIIIKLIFESKNVKEPYNWHVTCISKWGCYWFFRSSVKSDHTFFHERKMSLFVYWMQGRLTSSTYISSFLLQLYIIQDVIQMQAYIIEWNLRKLEGPVPFFLELETKSSL